MPIYESTCSKCGKYHTYFKSVANCLDTPQCCGKQTDKRVLSAPAGQYDIQPWESFVSPATGRVITSKEERRQDMKASGCREWEGKADELANAKRQKQYKEAEEDAKLDAVVRTAWANLSPAKKAQALKEA